VRQVLALTSDRAICQQHNYVVLGSVVAVMGMARLTPFRDLAAVCMMASALSGCEPAPDAAAKQAVAAKLLDPSHATFTALRINSVGSACGEFYMKNGVGAYVGSARFRDRVVDGKIVDVQIAPQDVGFIARFLEASWGPFCG
jgi:hypothetical protein